METTKDNCNLATNDEVEPFKTQLPPLENPLIVDVVAYQLSHNSTLDDIKNFRLVCNLWKNAVPEPWKSYFQIHTIYQHQNSSNQDAPESEDENIITLAQLRDLPNTNLFNGGTIELHYWKLEECHFSVETLKRRNQSQHTLENWFWTKYRSDVTSLTFTNCDSLGTFTIFSETILKALPNLKTLRVIDCNVSDLGWEAMRKRYWNQREFFTHLNLRNIYLDIEASDEQFNCLWSPFTRSLSKLDHLSVRRLKRAQSSYKWVFPLLRYWTETPSMKTLTFGETGESSKIDLYRFSMSRPRNNSQLKVVWDVFEPYPSSDNLFTCRSLVPYLRPSIIQLHLSGQVFKNLCFLKELKNLQLLIWSNGEMLDDNDSIIPYDITNYECIKKSSYPTLHEIKIHSSITIGGCSCEPLNPNTTVTAFRIMKEFERRRSGRYN